MANENKKIVMVTTNYVPDKKIAKLIGTIFGVTVRSRGLGGNLMAGLRSLAGGEIKEYTQMLSEARNYALDRLRDAAEELGANAVVDVRFDTSEVGNTMNEIVAYGTAVIVEDFKDPVERVSLS